MFQGFHLGSLGSRLTAALAGAGLALTVAVALAVSIKVFGIGLLGRSAPGSRRMPKSTAIAVGVLGSLVVALAVGMPIWLDALGPIVSLRFANEAGAKI